MFGEDSLIKNVFSFIRLKDSQGKLKIFWNQGIPAISPGPECSGAGWLIARFYSLGDCVNGC